MEQTRTLKIDGMSCENCVRHVADALKALPDLTVNEVGIGIAVVTYDAAKLPDDSVVAALRDAGYQAQVSA